MMTVHKVGALDAARYADYLSSSRDEERKYAARAVDRRGDYYLSPTSQDTPTAEPLGVWTGTGAKALGLSGREVDEADLLRVWEGKDPATGELLVRRGGNGEHVAAVDCTFSAPKSVSIEWGLCKDEARRAAIEAAQTRAVEAALGHLERECDLMRRRIGGDIRHETSGGLVVARFRHHTSRVTKEQEERGYGADPQLHDHCVVANLALRRDGHQAANGGEWGAIDSRSILLMQVEMGFAYRIQLQHELRLLGYRTHIVGDHFELVGISQAAIDEFSSREREVKAAIDRFTQEHGRSPREDERRNLVVYSRGGKDPNPFGDRDQWEERTRSQGIAPVRTSAYDAGYAFPTPRTLEEITADTVSGITRGQKHLTRESAVVDERELRKGVIRELQREGAGHDAEIPYFRPLLEATHGSDELVRVDGRHWTTRAHLATERFVVDSVRARARTGGHALDPKVIEEHISSARVPLDAEQAAAVRSLCDRRAVGLVIAEAGTGKGEVARAAAQAHRASGRRVVAVATAGETAQRLGKEIGADDARSVDSLVHAVRSGRLELGPRDLVVVDEAGQLETRGRWDRLLVAAQDAKLVAIGDPAQFPSIEAGGLLPVLEREVGASHLTRVYRAREEWLRDAWGAIRAGRGREAIEEFDRRGLLHIAPRRKDAREAMVAAWDRDRQGRPVDRYLMVTDTTNREVDRLNALAQGRRLDRGEIGGVPVEVTFRDPEDPEYTRHERLYRGDRVILKRHVSLGPRDAPLKNGQTATVMARDGERVILAVEGREMPIAIAPQDQDALRLNYAQHAVGAQGRTVDRVYGLFGGWSTDQESGYVSTTRCREVAELFADADTLAVETERRSPGDSPQREAPVEAIPEEEWHAAAREVLATRYETSRPKLAAVELLARETEAERTAGPEQAVPEERSSTVRWNTHAPASTRQREYVAALGGELGEGATWVEASLAIDRLRGEPEGEHAARLLLRDGQTAERVVEELDLAAGRRGAMTTPLGPPEPMVVVGADGIERSYQPSDALTVGRRAEPEPAMEPVLEADRAGHLDRGEVEAGLLGDPGGPVIRSEEPNPPGRSMERAQGPPEVSTRPLEAGADAGGSASELERPEQGEPAAARGLRVLEEERPHREAEEQERRERERWLEPDDDVEASQQRALEQEYERHREMERDVDRDMGMDMEF